MNGRHGNRRVFHPPSGAAGTNRPDADSPPHYDIGPFRLDTVARVLVRDGLTMSLGRRAVDVLHALVARANEYVSREELIAAAWPGRFVEESNLSVQVSAIRRVLGQVAGADHWIETLARRGYRFVGPVAHPMSPGSAPAGFRTALPVPMTTFVGRERELAEIKRLLPGLRLLTLVGPGGIGKTRLALEACADLVDAYRDGVRMIDLAPIADGEQVASAFAHTLGLPETAGAAATADVCARLRSRNLLLFVDNCEQVLEACRAFAQALLVACQSTTIIATSREPLRLAGEQLLVVPPLSLPDPGAPGDEIGKSEAVQLFVERARRVQPDFASSPARVESVAALCNHLDGIPLALELAAARVRTLPVEEINERIGDRFRLLTSPHGTALPRHQTLRSTLDWSHDLLSEAERILLRRIAVLPGSFALDAACAVGADDAVDEYEVIDVLAQLVSRSLVMAETDGPAARYRLLETTRAYATEKLVESGEMDVVARRHAEHFRRRCERAAADWFVLPDDAWHAQYAADLDNVRAALDWARKDAPLGIAVAAASGPIWRELSLKREGRRRLGAALEQIDAATPVRDQAWLWTWFAVVTDATPTQTVDAWRRAIDLHRAAGDAHALGFALMRLAGELTYMGRCDEARRHFAEAEPLVEPLPPKVRAEYALAAGSHAMLTGDTCTARREFERAVALCREAGAERMMGSALGNLADASWIEGDLDAALASYRESVELARKAPVARRAALGFALTNLAGVLTHRGDLAEALVAAQEGLPLREEFGLAWSTLDHLALRAARAGRLRNAALLAGFADAMHAAKQCARQPNEARSRAELAALLERTFAADERERLAAAGALLCEAEACHIALGR